jgi:hypothetical protein
VTDASARTEAAAWLCSADAAGPLAEARAALAARAGDPLAAGALLRRAWPELGPARAAAVLEQAELGRLARERYGIDDDLLLTRDGLEQATRPAIAARRARLLVADGARTVLDLTGGLGFDVAAFLAAGLAVTVVERDPATALLLARNCPGAVVVADDATRPGLLPGLLAGLEPRDAVFVDPARRDPAGARDAATARARPERDPERWSPPWAFVASIPHPRVVVKTAPGFTPPRDWRAEWVSVDRSLVECTAYSWPAFPAARRAVLLQGSVVTLVDADDDAPPVPVGALGTWLHEPDPAVVRTGAVPALGAAVGLASVGPDSSWLTSDAPSTGPALRSYHVVGELTGSARQQRRQVADLGIRRLTVKSRDVDVDPRAVLRGLGVAEGAGPVLVMTRRDGRVVSLLAEPAAARSD